MRGPARLEKVYHPLGFGSEMGQQASSRACIGQATTCCGACHTGNQQGSQDLADTPAQGGEEERRVILR